MLFDQAEQHGHTDQDAHDSRDGERPAARVDGREHEEEIVKEEISVRKEAADQSREAVQIDRHRQKVGRQKREHKDEYEIFEHIAQSAADVSHDLTIPCGGRVHLLNLYTFII